MRWYTSRTVRSVLLRTGSCGNSENTCPMSSRYFCFLLYRRWFTNMVRERRIRSFNESSKANIFREGESSGGKFIKFRWGWWTGCVMKGISHCATMTCRVSMILIGTSTGHHCRINPKTPLFYGLTYTFSVFIVFSLPKCTLMEQTCFHHSRDEHKKHQKSKKHTNRWQTRREEKTFSPKKKNEQPKRLSVLKQ